MPASWTIVLVALLIVLVLLALRTYLWLLEALYPERLRTTEVYTVTTRDLWKIRVCRYRRGRTSGEPVLLVHGAGANHHNFTIPEGACLIDHLVERGFDCWAVDLRLTGTAQPPFERKREDASIDDCLLYDLPAVIRHIRQQTSYGRIHWIGHSLGGMLLYAYAQHFGTSHIASGTTLGSPIGFIDAKLKVGRIPGFVLRNPNTCGIILRAVAPILLLLKLPTSLFPVNMRNLHPRINAGHFYNTLQDPMPKMILALAHWAKTKTWRMLDDKLDVLAGLPGMDFPLLAIFAPRDPFVDPGHARRFFDSLAATDKRFMMMSRENGCQNDYDHCDLAFAPDSTKVIFTPITEWLTQHPIEERTRAEEFEEETASITTTLSPEQRTEILTGNPYEHAQATPTQVETPTPDPPHQANNAPRPFTYATPRISPPAETTPETPPRPKTTKAKTPTKPKAKAKAAPAPKTKAPKPTPAAKAKPKPKPKPAAKPKATTAAKATASKPKPTAKAKPKAAPKPTAKATAKAKPKAAPKPKPAPKPTPKTKAKPSLLTRSAILSASEALKNLDKKK